MIIPHLSLYSVSKFLPRPAILRKKSLNNLRTVVNQTFRNKNVTQDFQEKLCLTLGGGKLKTSLAVRNQYGADEGYHDSSPPDIVAFPSCVDDISKIVKLCSQHHVPVIPHGSGTGIEHGIGAIMGGVSVDLALLNSIIELNTDDFDCTVEAGMTRKALNSYLRDTGLMFPVDPAAEASIGGMVSTSASGTNAVRYGTMKENVLNLEVVLPDGSVLHTAGPNKRVRKSSAGYNLTELFVGSEGTLGIITKATLRLHAVPEVMISAVSSFKSVQDAINAVVEVLQNNIPIARVEFLDELSMTACKKYSGLDYPISPHLFFEFHGSKDVVFVYAKQVEKIIKDNYKSNFIWAEDPESRNTLWNARHQIYYATQALKPGFKALSTDVCVPISKLTEMIIKTQQDIRDAEILGTIVGHVGDGNFHTLLIFDPASEKDVENVKSLANKITERALCLNGTCTGEHGVGVGKISYLETEYGEAGIQAMKSIKKALDPFNIMNPGKVLKVQE